MRFVIAAAFLASLLVSGKSSAFPVDTNNFYTSEVVKVAANGGEQELFNGCNSVDDWVLYIDCWTDDSTASLVSFVGNFYTFSGFCHWNNHGSTRGYRYAAAVCVHK